MRLDPAGLPFIGGALLLALVAGAAVVWVLAIPFIALGAFFAFFFRDPERAPPAGDDAVISPADGRVIRAGSALEASAPPGDWQQISIFLSPDRRAREPHPGVGARHARQLHPGTVRSRLP